MWRGSSDLHPQSQVPPLALIYEALCSSLLCCCSFPMQWEMPEASEGEITEQFCFHWRCHCASNTSHPKYNPLQTARKRMLRMRQKEVKEIYLVSVQFEGGDEGKLQVTFMISTGLSSKTKHVEPVVWWLRLSPFATLESSDDDINVVIRHKLSYCSIYQTDRADWVVNVAPFIHTM